MRTLAIILGGVDAKEQQPVIEQAAAEGIKIVGWHAGPQAGIVEGIPQVFYNVTTNKVDGKKVTVNSVININSIPNNKKEMTHFTAFN